MAFVGLVLCAGGFALSVGGLALTQSVAGRTTIAIVGIAISLAGITGFTNRACQKNAYGGGGLEKSAPDRISDLCTLDRGAGSGHTSDGDHGRGSGIAARKAEDRAKGDPDGGLTGNVSDISVADSKKGLTVADIVNQIGQNKIAINFVWTLFTGYLVMFMQLGFALLETGLCRAKNANHTMMMNVGVYGIGMFAYWLIGFAIQEGGVGGVANLGGIPPLNSEFTMNLFGKPFGLFGQSGMSLPTWNLRCRGDGSLPVPDGVHGHRRDDSDGRSGGTLEVFGLRDNVLLILRFHLSFVR
jgi:hypothetical protein